MANKAQLIDYWNENFQFTPIELNAFQEVERAIFIPDSLKDQAYQDIPLPLIREKTISQPTTVMIMVAALELQLGEKVFEIGTGSGYNAAVMSKIVGDKGKVISTEVIPELVEFSKKNLKKSGITNVEVFEEDGSRGYEKYAPYDKMIITAACKEFPKLLIEQLKVDGIIVGPVGDQDQQEMVKGTKNKDGTLQLDFLGTFLFTPMHGKYGFVV